MYFGIGAEGGFVRTSYGKKLGGQSRTRQMQKKAELEPHRNLNSNIRNCCTYLGTYGRLTMILYYYITLLVDIWIPG